MILRTTILPHARRNQRRIKEQLQLFIRRVHRNARQLCQLSISARATARWAFAHRRRASLKDSVGNPARSTLFGYRRDNL